MSKPPAEGTEVEPGSPSRVGRRRSQLWWPPGVVAAVLAVLALIAVLTTWAPGGPPRRPVALPALIASISVEPFTTPDSALRSWNSQAFAESLAAQLANIRGLEARVQGAGTVTGFTLRGDVARRNGRLVITTRLGRAGDAKSTVWTATYWRSENPGVALADDIAAGVAEAVYSDLVRLDLTSKSKR